MEPVVLLFLVVSTMLGATGMYFLKRSAGRFSIHPGRFLRNPEFLLGGGLYAVSLPVYLFALKRLPVTVAYPLTSMTYVWALLLSHHLLKERVDAWRWAGVGLIIGGITLVSVG